VFGATPEQGRIEVRSLSFGVGPTLEILQGGQLFKKGKSMKLIIFSFCLALATCQAPLRSAQAQQTRAYDAQGRSVGTAVPQGKGSTRYYDARGNSLGTSTTTGNTTRFYNERGQPTGSTTTPTTRGVR
jgi:YD repeat-containing protein